MANYRVDDIHNVALVGHEVAGKTSLADALLFKAKAVDRRGAPEDGTSVSDYDDEEKRLKYSIDTSILLDVLTGSAEDGPRSARAMRRAIAEGAIVVSTTVWAEVHGAFDDTRSVSARLERMRPEERRRLLEEAADVRLLRTRLDEARDRLRIHGSRH